ncbi:MAG: T9SS type A sorting domain-containing protein, partial [Saprospiraceae bacterium]|nr:T9SS type A sorting domain-containing protein [Saprospiraceae bacterium]
EGGTFSYEYSLDGTNWQPSPFFPGLADGVYAIYARDIKQCADSTEFLLNTIKTIDLSAVWGLTLSPNPGTGLFYLNLQQAPASLHGDIFDMTGRSLRRMDFTPGNGVLQTQIDVQDLPQGIYLLRLTDGVQTGTLRLSVVR